MTSDGKLTIYATPWAKQCRDDINSMNEFDEGDDLVRELNGDLRKVVSLYPEDFCARGFKCDPSKVLEHNVPPGTVQETPRTYQCRCWTREGEKCTDFFETHNARVAHEVHVCWLGGTHGPKLYVTTMTIFNACPMCGSQRELM